MNRFDVLGSSITEASENIHVYPNPFEIWGYDSKAVFTNLKPGEKVRIYTFTGVLVNELTASENSGNGVSEVEWNGLNFEGNYVGSGVFFFTGIDTNGRGFKGKMVVVRR